MLLEPEESRARPSAAGDQSGDLGQGAIALAPVENAILTDDYLMGGTLPFAQENGAGAGLTGRAGSPGCDRFTEEHAAGRSRQSAEHALLHLIGNRPDHQGPRGPG